MHITNIKGFMGLSIQPCFDRCYSALRMRWGKQSEIKGQIEVTTLKQRTRRWSSNIYGLKYEKEDTNQANLHHCPSNHYSSRERLGCCHGNRGWSDRYSDRLHLLIADGGWVDHGICSHCDRSRNGQLKEGERNGLPFYSLTRLPSIHLLPSCSVFHFHSSVDRLMATQVIAVFKLLVTYGADMSGPGRPRHRLN